MKLNKGDMKNFLQLHEGFLLCYRKSKRTSQARARNTGQKITEVGLIIGRTV